MGLLSLPRKAVRKILSVHRSWGIQKQFQQEFTAFKRQSDHSGARFALDWADRSPCLDDRTASTGFDRHYVFHTAWAARVLASTRPAEHVDISSSLFFTAMVSAFVPIRFYDYRPVDLQLTGFQSDQGDLLALPFKSDSIPSLSCMHVVEHVGLGRYGDALNAQGDLQAIAELKRVLAPGGDLLFVVPIGKARIMFNAHRIYSYDQVLEYFGNLSLIEFALIPENESQGGLILNASKDLADAQAYGCGCFWFKK